MTTELNSLLITAALTLSAAAAYGQNQVVANIPFSFRTAAGVQPAGQYAASHEGEASKLRNSLRRSSWIPNTAAIPADRQSSRTGGVDFFRHGHRVLGSSRGVQ